MCNYDIAIWLPYEELGMEVHVNVQEVVIKTIPKEKKCSKANGCLRRPYK